MAQSIIHQNKGTTLIELIIYMGLFVILVGGVLYSAFYLQNILQYNAYEYKAEEQIYRQLRLVQQHMDLATSVEISSSSLKIHNPHGYIEPYLQNHTLHIKYTYPTKPTLDIVPYPYLKFQQFSFTQETGHESLSGNSIIWVDIERVDSKNKLKKLKEWLVDGV